MACSHPHSCVDLYTDLYSKYNHIYMFVCLYRIQETRKGSGLSGKRDRRVGKKRRLRNNTKDVFKNHVETLLFLKFPLYDMHI